MTGLGDLFPSLHGARPGRDLVAALSLAALAIPEQLATARLAGVLPAQGIAVFAAASVAMVLVARDRSLSVGADSTTAPLIAAAALTAAPLPATAMIAALVGAMLLAVSLFRLEWIARLLSKPVAAGMLAGISAHILIGRLPTALGLEVSAQGIRDTVSTLVQALPGAHLAPLAMTLVVAAVSFLGPLSHGRVPAALIAILGAALAAFALDPGGALFPRLSAAEGGFGLGWSPLDPDLLLALLPLALSIAFLCLFQTTVVLREAEADSAALRRNALGAVGLANLAAAAIGGFAVNASPPRSELARVAGATSQLAGLGAALIGLALLLFAPDLLRQLPEAALAGVLVYVALHLFPLRALRELAQRSPIEAAIAVAGFGLVVLLPLQTGLPMAMLLSLIHASTPLFVPQIAELRQVPGTTVWWQCPAGAAPERPGVLVLGLTAPVNFANAEGLAADIRQAVARHAGLRLVVLECAGVLSVDLTGAEVLAGLLDDLRAGGVQVALARVEAERAREDLQRSGFLDRLGEGHLFQSVDAAVRSLAP